MLIAAIRTDNNTARRNRNVADMRGNVPQPAEQTR
jgi:hypothetical protein